VPNLILIQAIIFISLTLIGIYTAFRRHKERQEDIKKEILGSNPMIQLSNRCGSGKVVVNLKPGETGYHHFRFLLDRSKIEGNYFAQNTIQGEGNKAEIDRLLEEKEALEALLIENGIRLPNDKTESYKAYSWKD
jgi:hypothetical protein